MTATHCVWLMVNIEAADQDEVEGATGDLECTLREIPWVLNAKATEVESLR